MHEQQKTYFQIKPKSTHFERPCMFMNQGFDIGRITHITEVTQVTGGVQYYKFFVELMGSKLLEFEFNMKTNALLAHRELARAFTKTGEFEDVTAGTYPIQEAGEQS